MVYSWRFSAQLAIEFKNFPKNQQDAILDFTDIFENFGLSDFSKYPGKISPSWSGAIMGSAEYVFAFSNELWHYHIGIPRYNYVHSKYATSDWVLHFQWPGQGSSISLVDVYSHYTSSNKFYLPPSNYLDDEEKV
ncbi:hypothetical protein [Burkholderia gladioli]|uniref:hypothetical protein n=1 Tax=Burkholderia gladioli TaxID=28095 RepID=UPI00163E621B|nr:hypothetical protein [Burkholderia gladioli]